MDDAGVAAGMIVSLLFVVIDFFFFGFGQAVDCLNAKEVERKAEEGNKKSKYLLEIIDNPRGFINTLQLVVTFLHILIGVMCVRAFQSSLRELMLMLLAALYILLSFGILLPKKIAMKKAEKMAYFGIRPIYALMVLLTPFTRLVSLTVKLVLRILGMGSGDEENEVTEEEIIDMVNEGHEQGVIQASEAELISNIFEYGDKEAQDIMTHRNDIIAIDGSTTLKDAIAFMLTEKNSRYPVYEENIDHIIGILHLKDALRMQTQKEDDSVPIRKLKGLLRKPLFVPQTKNIDELFKKMQSEKLQMVIVVNEYGQTDGLIAMEDILEEIVGNILDEYDDDAEYIKEKGLDEYVMEGKTPLEELEERFGIEFEKDLYETLNGFMISKLDRIPEPNEQFEVSYQGYHFKILSVENKMIQRVLVTKDESVLDENVK